MYELSGTVKEIFDEQTFDSGFNKREFVVTTDAEKYPQEIKFECVKDKVAMLDTLSKGDAVKVSFDIRGREWKGSYFVNLSAWKVATGAAASSSGKSGGASEGESVIDDDPPF